MTPAATAAGEGDALATAGDADGEAAGFAAGLGEADAASDTVATGLITGEAAGERAGAEVGLLAAGALVTTMGCGWLWHAASNVVPPAARVYAQALRK